MNAGPRQALAACALLAVLAGCTAPAEGPRQSWALESGPGPSFRSAALADMDGDGHLDLLLGLRDWDGRGGARLHPGTAQGPGASPIWEYLGPEPAVLAGIHVGWAGDLDRDGHLEAFVSATRLEGRGGVWFFRGGPAGLSTRPWATLRGSTARDDFGEQVVVLGDLRGDGSQALAVAAFGHDRQRGKILVYESRGGPPRLVWSAQGEAQGDWFGYSLLGPGDLDGDGYADLLASAKNCDGACLRWLGEDPRFEQHQSYFQDPPTAPTPGPEQASNQAGKLYFYRGGPQGLGRAPAFVLEGEEPHELFGFALAAVPWPGGAPLILSSSTGWRLGRGRLALLTLGPHGFTPRWRAQGPAGGGPHRWGYALASPGDLDGDGLPDLVVSNPVDAELSIFLGGPNGSYRSPPVLLKPEPPSGAQPGMMVRLLAVGPVPAMPGRARAGFFVILQARMGRDRDEVFSTIRAYHWAR